ncbi:MFS transporter [Amycolatopsis sp. K13G38]|uniref:MFS transporter n=1 Tax=Amycolatopsis acididurans TaxID=2724524 RepID=A0ABX1J5U1_9PSEU|nr:MFS transporter [Amycolatopsis acididurans]NKQ55172.1 MFS transporter [Amycolatopsis acididurans]
MALALLDVTPLRSSRKFRGLWLGRAFSGFGSQMTIVVVMFQVWQLTGSTVWTGAVGLAQALPVIGFGLFAGSVVDRADRRRVYLAAQTGQAICALILAVQGFLGHFPVYGVLLLIAAESCFVTVGGPASRTFIPRLLPESQLPAELALNHISFQAAMLIGPAVGGLVLAWLGVGGCYLIDAITFGLAFLGAFGLPPMPPDRDAARPGLGGVLDGLRFLISHRVVRAALLTDLAATVLAMPISLFPQVNAEKFGNDPRTLGLFLSAIAVGGVLASVFSGTFTRRSRLGLVMLVASATWGAALALFGVVPGAWLGLCCLVIAGAADTISVVARGTIVQAGTPDHLRGRVSAAEQIVGQAGPDIGNLRAGLVARLTSGPVALLSGGLTCLAAVALVGATTRELRN